MQYSPVPSAPPPGDDDFVNPLNTSRASAPILTDEELELEQLKQIQNEIDNLNLALITSELEYFNSEIEKIQNDLTKMDITKCDKQCQAANKSIESNTVDNFLKKEVNDIFNK